MPLSVGIAIMLGVLFPCMVLVLTLHTIYRPPFFMIRRFQARWPDVVFHTNIKQKLLALTIDDAPSEYTKSILEILRANDAKATFFVIGSQVPGYEHTLRDIVAAGSELGNHAMHDEPSKSLNDAELRSQIRAVDNVIEEAYKACDRQMPRYFRPGSGFFSTRMRRLVKSMGYRMILGDIYPHDPQIPFWRVNAWHILSILKPGGIIICHDRRSWTIPMLKKVLPQIKKKGYRVVTVTELLEAGGMMKVGRTDKLGLGLGLRQPCPRN